MAQADQQIDNASFPAVRTDITDNLAALFSQSSGPSAPAVTVAYQPWIDTSSSPAVWKVRNGTNTGWITVGTIDTTSGTFTVGGVTPISSGGTGATTAAAALAALLPSQTGNSGKALVTDGSLAAWGLVASGVSAQVFTSSGTYTPTAGKTTFLVFATGGGGGSDNSGTGYTGAGGGGGTSVRVYNSTELGASAAITVGAGGSVTPTSGGTTTFDPAGTGLTITGIGGSAGVYSSSVIASAVGGAGGGSTNSLFSLNGSRGGASGSAYGVDAYTVPGMSFWAGGAGRGGSGSAGTAGVVFILEW